jgi:hypothetical protein
MDLSTVRTTRLAEAPTNLALQRPRLVAAVSDTIKLALGGPVR